MKNHHAKKSCNFCGKSFTQFVSIVKTPTKPQLNHNLTFTWLGLTRLSVYTHPTTTTTGTLLLPEIMIIGVWYFVGDLTKPNWQESNTILTLLFSGGGSYVLHLGLTLPGFFRQKKFRIQIFLAEIFFLPKYFLPKIFFDPKFLWPKKFWTQNFFDPKFF